MTDPTAPAPGADQTVRAQAVLADLTAARVQLRGYSGELADADDAVSLRIGDDRTGVELVGEATTVQSLVQEAARQLTHRNGSGA